MKSKQELKKVFENGDKPKQEDFWEWQDSYWHKEENIPRDRIEGLEAIPVNFNMQWSSTDKKLSLIDSSGNIISEISLQSLDNEGTDLRYNTATSSLDLYNVDNELLDSISITDFVKNVGTQLSINSNTLHLKDSAGNVLSTVSFAINNIQNLQIALDGKLDRGAYTGTAQDIYDRFEGKIVADTNNIPKVGNGASGKVLENSNITQINGKIGIGLGAEASEKLEVNGNVKAIDFKGQSIKFNLQSSIAPSPNTLVPKTDGSGLIWHDNNNIQQNLVSFSSNFNYLYGSGNINTNTVYGKQSLNNNTSGAYNLAIGNQTMISNTTGASNTALGGDYTMGGNTTGSSNTVVGNQALQSNSTGNNNVVIGRLAGYNVNNSNKVLIGYNSGTSSTDGAICIGYSAGIGASGNKSIIIGENAGNNITGAYNIFIGSGSSGSSVGSGEMNTSVGFENMQGVNNGSKENSIVGWNCMTIWSRGNLGITNSNYNAIIGTRGGQSGALGNYNTLLGHSVGFNETSATGSGVFNNRILIGAKNTKVGSSIDDYPISVNMEAAVPYGKHNYKNLPLRFQLPNMTKTQRNALTSPTVGEMIWQTDNGNSGIRVFDGTNWLALQTTLD